MSSSSLLRKSHIAEGPVGTLTLCSTIPSIHSPTISRWGKMDPREVQEYVGNPKKWFKTDYLSFYTHWSEMFVSHCKEKRDFPAFYTTSGKMITMLQWFH
jgi:hypothetical protein